MKIGCRGEGKGKEGREGRSTSLSSPTRSMISSAAQPVAASRKSRPSTASSTLASSFIFVASFAELMAFRISLSTSARPPAFRPSPVFKASRIWTFWRLMP